MTATACSYEHVIWDEASFQNKPQLTRMLSPAKRPAKIQVSYHPGHVVKAFGWIDMQGRLGVMPSRQCKLPDFKAALQLLRAQYPADMTLILVLDNAKIHHGREMPAYYQALNIVPVFLPPYSADLSPQEQVWRLVRKPLKNKIFREQIDLQTAFDQVFAHLGPCESLLTAWVHQFVDPTLKSELEAEFSNGLISASV